jgi:isopentenyl diphosphate isomerase/L-lactate dehydrogenase-like FMN-dependent dehydrogenase
MIERADAAGCPVLVWTIDTVAGRNIETFSRSKRIDTRKCETCHDPAPGGFYKRKPMFSGFDPVGLTTNSPDYTWQMIRRIRDVTKMKLLIKGIETREDAQLCREYGVDGIIVSNHGGRAEESGRGTIECLPEVLQGAGQVPVLIDGGFRRGTDIFKALALGAKAIAIGRPYLWALSAFGQPGVEKVIDMMRLEFELVMRQIGTRNIAEITRDRLV